MTALPFQAPGDGELLHNALVYPSDPATTRRVLLVLAHGAGGGQSHPFMVRYARGLAERGIDVATFDFPYMQARRSAPDRAPVLEAAFRRVVVAAAKHPKVHPGKLFIGGKSMGGRMATHLAATADQWPEQAPPLSGVVVFGYPLNPPGGPSKRSADRVSHLARITVPMLIAQGTRDNFGGPADIAQAMPRAQVFEVPTGDHSFAVQKSSGRTQAQMDEEIIDAVVQFVTS